MVVLDLVSWDGLCLRVLLRVLVCCVAVMSCFVSAVEWRVRFEFEDGWMSASWRWVVHACVCCYVVFVDEY